MKNKKGWFCVTDYVHIVPDSPGFYAMYKQNLETCEHELLYIGTAYDLKRRLQTHELKRVLSVLLEYPYHLMIKCKVFEPKTKGRKSKGWYSKKDQINNERMLMEAELIKRLQPKLNKQWR